MKVQKTIKVETVRIAAGTGIMTLIMLAVFAVIGRFDYTVIVGAALGFIAAVLDFFILGITVQKAAQIQAEHPVPQQDETVSATDDEKPRFADPETAKRIKRKVQLSYYGRRLMLIAFAALGLTSFVNLVAVVVPMVFPKLFIQIRNLLQTIPKGADKIEK